MEMLRSSRDEWERDRIYCVLRQKVMQEVARRALGSAESLAEHLEKELELRERRSAALEMSLGEREQATSAREEAVEQRELRVTKAELVARYGEGDEALLAQLAQKEMELEVVLGEKSALEQTLAKEKEGAQALTSELKDARRARDAEEKLRASA